MIFNKYNSYTDTYTIGEVVEGNRDNTSTSSTSGMNKVTRSMWGNYDNGANDIDSDIDCEGNIYSYYADQTNKFKFNDSTGNLYADNYIQAPNIYATTALYIPDPTTHNKTDIVSLLYGYDVKIANLHSEVQGFNSRITANENAISLLQSSVNNHNTTLSNHSSSITNILNRLNELEQNTSGNGLSITEINNMINAKMQGSINNPIVLYSGRLRHSTVNNSQYYFVDPIQRDEFTLTATVNNGLMTIDVTPQNSDYRVNIYAGFAMQWHSGDTGADMSVTNIVNRNDGAHWFEVSVNQTYNTSKVYIREFHNGNANNDSWESTSWLQPNGVQSINLVLFGYVYNTNDSGNHAPHAQISDTIKEQQLKASGLTLDPLEVYEPLLVDTHSVKYVEGVSDANGIVTDNILPNAPDGYENLITDRMWYCEDFNQWIPVHIYRNGVTSYVMSTTIAQRVVSALVADGDTVVPATANARYRIYYITSKIM